MKYWRCWQDVGKNLGGMRRGTAPSPDGILNENGDVGGGRLVEIMLPVINLVFSESCQADWKRSLLVPLYKDGDKEEVGNYRGLP